jgi:hypothetical protein
MSVRSYTDVLQALRVFEAAQLYRVGRMVQEIVSSCNGELTTGLTF